MQANILLQQDLPKVRLESSQIDVWAVRVWPANVRALDQAEELK